MVDFRFSTIKEQAVSGLLLLPATVVQTRPTADKFTYFVDDLPNPETLQQELDLWVVSVFSTDHNNTCH